jgi:hypothetical protein
MINNFLIITGIAIFVVGWGIIFYEIITKKYAEDSEC